MLRLSQQQALWALAGDFQHLSVRPGRPLQEDCWPYTPVSASPSLRPTKTIQGKVRTAFGEDKDWDDKDAREKRQTAQEKGLEMDREARKTMAKSATRAYMELLAANKALAVANHMVIKDRKPVVETADKVDDALNMLKGLADFNTEEKLEVDGPATSDQVDSVQSLERRPGITKAEADNRDEAAANQATEALKESEEQAKGSSALPLLPLAIFSGLAPLFTNAAAAGDKVVGAASAVAGSAVRGDAEAAPAIAGTTCRAAHRAAHCAAAFL